MKAEIFMTTLENYQMVTDEENGVSSKEVVSPSLIITPQRPLLPSGDSSPSVEAKHVTKQPPLSAASEGGGGGGRGKAVSSSREQHDGSSNISLMTSECHREGDDNARVDAADVVTTSTMQSRKKASTGRRRSEQIIRRDSERRFEKERRRTTVCSRMGESHLVRNLRLQKAISTPDFGMLVASDPDPDVGGGRNFPWDCERLPMANRRSLSPERTSWGLLDTVRRRPSRLENNLLQDTAKLHLNDFETSYHSEGGGRSRQVRRATVPGAIQYQRNLGEVMDPNALRYLPKILRDTYAQRQTRRASLLGEAQLASIDLRLRLQRPENLPYYQDIRGSILILDLSGFTALGERLRLELGPREGAAEFASRVNETLSTMVQQVHEHWGDVLMFAGDALICLFEEKDYGGTIFNDDSNAVSVEQKIRKCVRDCCLSVLGKFAVGKGGITVHGGAGYGTIRCFFLGTPSTRPGSCAFVVSGHPLKQSGKLLNKAGRGEVYIDGESAPLTEKMGMKYMEQCKRSPDEIILAGQDEVMPRDKALVADQELTIALVGGFEVNSQAMAYLGTLAARRCDQGSQNAMSMLMNELRPVAIVFVGLHEFDDIDPRDSTLLALMNEAFNTLSRITHACNGAVRDMLFDDKGCVFISVFGAHSHEVNPCFDATVCAMRMESALKDLLARFSLGVSYGECFCGEVGPSIRSDYVVMGPEVNLAARLMGKASNRSTLVSKRIFTHSQSFIHFQKSEEIQVKGTDGFFHAYIPQTRIERLNSIEITEPHQPFVLMPSRQHAVDSLMQAKERAMSGIPTTAFVSGGPFLGKSRLINEVAEKAASDGFTILQSFRTSLDSFTSFFPLRQIVSGAMIICANNGAAGNDIGNEISAANYLVDQNIFNKTDRFNIGSIVPTVADAQLLGILNGLNPNARTRSIVDSLMKILKLLQPLLMILEGDGDIDHSSWSLLAELMQCASSGCPQVMLIVSSRDSPTITSAASNLRKNAIQVKLTPFEKYETEQYLRVLLGVRNESITIEQQLLDVVHDRANGCPLFIECVVRWALEKNVIEYVGGSKKMRMLDETSDDVRTAIPRELSNILLAPFNKLPPPLWDALKIASCIGYSFDADLYSTLNQNFDFMPKIRELSAQYGCFEQTGSHVRWKQQAIYEAVKSLLMVNQRQKIHRMIVRAFEQNKINHGELDDIKESDFRRLLGRHCALAEDWSSACEQYMRAGDRALAIFNFHEASKMYEEAIDFQAKMSDQLSLRYRLIPTINLGTCLREIARYKEAEALLTRCLNEAQGELSDVTLDEELYVRALTALASLYQAQSKYDAARRLFERAVPIARNIQESKSSLWVAGNIAGYAETLRKSGDLPQAERHHREALEIRMRAVEEKSCTELELSVSYTQLGCTLAGMRNYEEAFKQHHNALGLRYRYLDFSHVLVSESLNYCAETLCALDRGGEGISLALHAVEIRKLIFGTSHPAYAHALSVLASCYHAVGRFFDACIFLERCLEICEIAFHKNHANVIPNLMNYGNVLRSTGDLIKARTVYQRAIAIHQLNFKEGQQARQLEKCSTEVNSLTKKIDEMESSLKSLLNDMPQNHLVPADVESNGTPVVVVTDIGRDVDDELALVLLSALRRKRILNPIAVIATLSPQRERAHLARGCMDAMGMPDVPVGIGSCGGVAEGVELDVYGADYSRSSPCIFESGGDLMCRALESVPPNSAVLLCIASLSDVAAFIRDHEDLFTSKVKEVVLMGGVVSTESGESLIPDSAYNNSCDISSARFVYRRCQELGVPTATISRWAAYDCPIPPQLLDELAQTEHMVATNIRSVSKLSIDQLWNKVILCPSDPRREKIPPRCDVSWFCRTFMDKEITKEWSTSVWLLVKKLNMYDPLAVLLCVPAYRTTHFNWQTKVVNGVSHIVVGTSERDTGINTRQSLYAEYASLFLYAFLTSLHKNDEVMI